MSLQTRTVPSFINKPTMETEPEPFTFKFNPKHDSQQILKILKALKQASHDLQKNPDPDKPNDNTTLSNSSATKALLELEHESDSILSNDPQLTALSTHLTALKTLINNKPCHRNNHHGLKSFITRRVNSYEVSKLAGLIESEIQAWIDREFVKTLTQTLEFELGDQATKHDIILIDLMEQFAERISKGFDRELQDSILRSRVFTKLESILFDCKRSNRVRESSAFAISELIRFNKDVFVGQVSMSETVCGLVSLSSVRSIQILCMLISSIKSPIVDEIVSNGKMAKLVGFLSCDDYSIRGVAMDCVLEIGYFGRKEAIDAMLEEGLVKKLVELQRCENENENDNEDEFMEVCNARGNNPFASCVARFAVQLEVGEGLRRREKRALKQEVLKRVKEAHVSEAEAATIIAEVLWGATP